MSTISKLCREAGEVDVLMAIDEVDTHCKGGANNPYGASGKPGKNIINGGVAAIDNRKGDP